MRHALALALFSGLTAACSGPPQTGKPAISQSDAAGAVGRYVIVHSPHVERDTVLLDTATGKSWTMVNNESRDALIWRPLARGDNPAEYEEWLKNNPEGSTPASENTKIDPPPREKQSPVKSDSTSQNRKFPWEKDLPADSTSVPQNSN